MKVGEEGVVVEKKQIKRLQVEQQEKERKKRKRKEKCTYMCEQTLPRQAQIVLTATMHDVGSRSPWAR